MLLILSSLVILSAVTRSLTSCLFRISLSAKKTKILSFSTDCWKFKTVFSLISIIILRLSMMPFSLLVVFRTMFRITSTSIAEQILITFCRSNKFLFFCAAFIRIATRLAISAESTSYSRWELIKLSTSSFHTFVASTVFSTFRFNFSSLICRTRSFNDSAMCLSISNTFIFCWRSCGRFFKIWTIFNDTTWRISFELSESGFLKQLFHR